MFDYILNGNDSEKAANKLSFWLLVTVPLMLCTATVFG